MDQTQKGSCFVHIGNSTKDGGHYLEYGRKKVPYIPQTEYQFLDQKRKKINAMKKLITKFDISTNDLNLQL